jgi:hypothetical protein
MNAADDIEVACFAGGEDVGDFCGAIFSATVALLSEAERDEMDEDQEAFARRVDGMFGVAVRARAERTRNPDAFCEGWWSGFKSRVEREWPVE